MGLCKKNPSDGEEPTIEVLASRRGGDMVIKKSS